VIITVDIHGIGGKWWRMKDMPTTIKVLPIKDLSVAAVIYQCDEDEEGRAVYEYEIYDQAAFDRAVIPTDGCRCDCCGQQLKYACIVEHKPTTEIYYVGRQCANKIDFLRGQSSTIENASVAMAERALCNAREKEFRRDHPEAIPALDWARTGINRCAQDIASKLRSYGLSDKQIEFLVKLHEDDKAKRASATGTCPTGKQEVTGTILNVKKVPNEYSRYGGTIDKVLVDLGNGAKVYGNGPSNEHPEKGQIVKFSASFEPSQKDNLFGFWKRPTKWTVLNAPPVVDTAATIRWNDGDDDSLKHCDAAPSVCS
jgi:hypothetical protein